ncbi:truncated hemoglobin [Exiguobacterium oxidotolerans]|nr:protoglobin domain-containing protein [Exiguobacterium oxidotolerans]
MLYDDIGKHPMLEQLVARFYQLVYADPILRPIFPDDRQRVEQAQVIFLTHLTGGPRQYELDDSRTNLAMIHRLLPIEQQHAFRWIELMEVAIYETLSNRVVAERLMERLRIGALNVLRICEAHQEP